MPAKGSIGQFHGRKTFLTLKLWRKYKRETGVDITYKEFVAIFCTTIEEVKKWILREPAGFRLPVKLGNIAVNTFKTYGTFKTYINVRHEGKPILNHNLHTGGNVYKLQWFHSTRNYNDRVPFWFFVASRDFKRNLAKVLKRGVYPNYNTYMQDQFTDKRNK
jgi:hypothetical protein